MKVEEKLKKNIWPHFLSALIETEVNKYGIINRNLCSALSLSVEECVLESFQAQSKTWLKKYLTLDLSNESLAVFGGMCDVAFSFWKVNKKYSYYEEEMKKMNQILFYFLRKRILIIQEHINIMLESDFDTISGLTGIISYCFLEDYIYHELNEKILEIFIAKTNSATGWIIENRYLDDVYKKRFPNGYLNFGMSHGILGPLIVMCQALKMGYKLDGLKESIKKIIQLYGTIFDETQGQIPCIIDASDYKKKFLYNRDSWSYGTSVMFYSLMQAAKIVEDDKLYDLYRKALLEKLVVKGDITKYGLISPTLLNGYGGMLCLLKKIYEEENTEGILEEINRIEKHLMDLYDVRAKFGFRHYEYKCGKGNIWSVESYNLEGFSYGALGVIIAITGGEDLMKSHLLLY